MLLYFAKRREGFEDFLQLNTRYTKQQDAYFQDQAGKEIYVNPGLKLDLLNDAFYQPDLYLATSKDRDYKDYLTENPYNAFSGKDTMCRQARHPRDLPARAPRDITACGWWFHPDVPSVGAYGSLNGPVNNEGLPPGGQWTWDVPTAVMKEDIKFCKRIKSCDLLTIPGVMGRCGFCTRLSYAVPINADGSDKYPDSQIGACGELNKKTPDECKPAAAPIVTSDGVNCGSLGRPSPDNNIRLYNKDECDVIDGNWYSNGECLMKGGGSYSAACSGLNSALQTVSPRTCDPGPSGALSKECLISIASGIGFTRAGAVLGNLYNNVRPSDMDKQAIDLLATIGVSIPDAVLSSGMTDVQTAGTTYTQIYNAMTSAPKPMIKEAAKWLAIGSDSFDVCGMEAKVTGPFDATCLQQAFREAGCQASGAAYPSKATAAKYASMTWGEVGNLFKKTHDAMLAPDVATQDKASKDCLGVSYYRPPPTPPAPKQYDGYALYPQSDRGGADIACYFDGRDASDCKARCDADPDCKSFNSIKNNSGGGGCCYKRSGFPVTPYPKSAGVVNLYKKAPKKFDGYTLTTNADRGGADIVCHTDGRNTETCKKQCDADDNCMAFNEVDLPGWGAGKGCCVKADASPISPFNPNVADVHFYSKTNVVPFTVSGTFTKTVTGGRTYFIITGPATINVRGNTSGVQFFAVGGGGGAGNKNGGGGGGVQTNTSSYTYPTQRANIKFLANTSYYVNIGAGGRPGVNGVATSLNGPGYYGTSISIVALGGAFGGATGVYCPASSGGSGGGGCASVGAQGGSVSTPNSIVANAGAGAGGNPKSYWDGGPGINYNGVVYGASGNATNTSNGGPNTGTGGTSNGNGGSGVFIISY